MQRLYKMMRPNRYGDCYKLTIFMGSNQGYYVVISEFQIESLEINFRLKAQVS